VPVLNSPPQVSGPYSTTAVVTAPHRRLPWIAAMAAIGVAGGAVAVLVLRSTGVPAAPAYVVVESQGEPRDAAAVTVQPAPVAVIPVPATTPPAPAPPDPAPTPGSGKRDPGRREGREGRESGQSDLVATFTQRFRKKQPQIAECFRTHATSVQGNAAVSVQLSVSELGAVMRADVLPREFAETSLGQCISKVASSTHFPALDGAVTVTIPIRVRAR
jgi:hypothetical protein